MAQHRRPNHPENRPQVRADLPRRHTRQTALQAEQARLEEEARQRAQIRARRRRSYELRRKRLLRAALLRLAGLILLLGLVILGIVLLSRSCAKAPQAPAAETQAPPQTTEAVARTGELPEDPDTTVTLLCLGDNLMHTSVLEAGLQDDGSYDFRPMYQYIKPVIQAADLACINQETIFINDPAQYSNYPVFGGPTAVGEALVDTGFDIITHATNHCYDKFFTGIQDTLAFWRQYPQITVLGIHDSQADADTLRVVECKGIRIALLNYTYGTNMGDPEEPYMIDFLDRDKMERDILAAKDQADIVLVFPHWGTENSFVPNEDQRQLGQFFADLGVGAVIGCHPHTLQPMEILTGKDGNQMPVFWSMGNFISHMSFNQNMLGGMASLHIGMEDGRAVVTSCQLIPTVTYGTQVTGKWEFYGMRLWDYTDQMAANHYVENTSVAELQALYQSIVRGTATAWQRTGSAGDSGSAGTPAGTEAPGTETAETETAAPAA